MPERRVLILCQQELTVCDLRQGKVHTEHNFALDETGQARFSEWLSQHRSTQLHLLVDLPDESYHLETLPHTVGADRKALLNRKMNQYFFGTPYTMVSSLGREKQGRRDERFLFSALTRPQALEPWVQAIQTANAAIAGIHSPAMLVGRLFDRAMSSAARLIVVTLGSGGLRQSYFENGQLRFSRLKPLVTDGIEEAAVNAYGEAVRVYQYLVGQRLLNRGNKVPVLCLSSPDHIKLLRQACVDTDELSFEFRSLLEFAAPRQLQLAAGESRIDALLVHMLLRNPPAAQFANTQARLDYRRQQWRTAIVRATQGALGLSIAFVIAAGASVAYSNHCIDEAESSTLIARQQYSALVQSLPPIPMTPEQLRNLIEQWDSLKAHAPDLGASLQPISAALAANPQVELKALNWHLAATPEDTTFSSTNAAPGWLVADIDAQLPASVGPSHRTQSENIDKFIADLKAGGGDSNARALERPFDTDSGKALKGGTGNDTVTERNAVINFSIRYWRRIGA